MHRGPRGPPCTPSSASCMVGRWDQVLQRAASRQNLPKLCFGGEEIERERCKENPFLSASKFGLSLYQTYSYSFRHKAAWKMKRKKHVLALVRMYRYQVSSYSSCSSSPPVPTSNCAALSEGLVIVHAHTPSVPSTQASRSKSILPVVHPCIHQKDCDPQMYLFRVTNTQVHTIVHPESQALDPKECAIWLIPEFSNPW